MFLYKDDQVPYLWSRTELMERLAAIFFKPVSVLCLKKAFIEILLRLSYLLFNYLFLSNFFLSFRKQKKIDVIFSLILAKNIPTTYVIQM